MKRTLLVAAGIVGAAAIAAPALGTPKDVQTNNSIQTDGTCTGGQSNQLIAMHPTLLWPPNHKYYGDSATEAFYFLATGDSDETIVLSTTGTHDQYDADGTEFAGSGNTGDEDGDGFADDVTAYDDGGMIDTTNSTTVAPAYVEEGTNTVQTNWVARAERAGTGIREDVPNRTYSLRGHAEFGDGGSCEVFFTIVVPHDMGKGDGNGQKDPVR